MKGSFYKEENGAVESHQYTLKVTQPTNVWMTIKPSAPKYGIIIFMFYLYIIFNPLAAKNRSPKSK